jgi:hypothetical protein
MFCDENLPGEWPLLAWKAQKKSDLRFYKGDPYCATEPMADAGFPSPQVGFWPTADLLSNYE